MSAAEGTRRILVSLDASVQGQAALQAAAGLAAALQAELHGLFVEDINLLRLAGLPFACEVAHASGAQRPLDVSAVEQVLQERAAGIRRALERAAAPAQLRWSFIVERGEFARATLAASEGAELLVIGRESVSPSVTQLTTRARPGPVLVVVGEKSPTSAILETASRLVSQRGPAQREHATVLLLQGSHRPPADQLAGCPTPLYCERIATNQPAAMVEAARRWNAEILVVDQACGVLDETAIDCLATQLACPLGIWRFPHRLTSNA